MSAVIDKMRNDYLASNPDAAIAEVQSAYDRRGTVIGRTKGDSTDSILKRMDYEDMLKEVSKLPPAERKDALKRMKRLRKEANNE